MHSNNTKEENERLKNSEAADAVFTNPHVCSQKNTDAEWTKKGDETYCGYENRALVDDGFKLVRDYDVTCETRNNGYFGTPVDGTNISCYTVRR